MNSEGRGFQIEFNTAKSPQDLGGGLRQIKDLLRTPETFRILNDIRRSFFYAKEYPKSRGAEIYDPRLKTPESSAKKLADYQKRHPGKLMYWGDLPDIVGAIIAVPRLIDLENIMNYIRYRCLNLLLEEDNLFLKNPDKIYRDVKEDMKMATSATMNWELQLHLIECLPFNFLEHILYKKQEILPAVEVEAMKQIIWGPLAQILLEKLDEYETINKEYIAWIKKHKVDF